MTPTSNPLPGAQAPGMEVPPQAMGARRALTRSACLSLLGPGGHGRVATTRRAIPVIIPVGFQLFGEDVVFSASREDGQSCAVTDAVVAFEADHLGQDGRSQWDVHVTGVAREMRQESGVSAFRLSSEVIAGWEYAEDTVMVGGLDPPVEAAQRGPGTMAALGGYS